MRYSRFILFALALIFGSSFSPIGKKHKTSPLFNGKDLSGWDTYVGPLYDTTKKKFDGEPVGLKMM
jgi:hypothetical protein